MNIRPIYVFVAFCAIASPHAKAALVDRGGGLIYDTVLNVTWLQDANYANTSGYASSTGGAMNWADANAWAAGLDYYDTVRGVTYSDWRLAKVEPVNGSTFNYSFSFDGSTDIGYNKTGTSNELAHLFYSTLGNSGFLNELGGVTGCYVSPSDTCLDNTGPFINFQLPGYWTGTSFGPDSLKAWGFATNDGYHDGDFKTDLGFALAVRDGDVAARQIPEPSTLVLLFAACAAALTSRQLSR